MIKLTKRAVKKNTIRARSNRPTKVVADISGNRKINSISYSKKKIQISRNWIGTRIGFCVVGRNPHS